MFVCIYVCMYLATSTSCQLVICKGNTLSISVLNKNEHWFIVVILVNQSAHLHTLETDEMTQLVLIPFQEKKKNEPPAIKKD